MTIEFQCRSKETELTILDGIQIFSNEYDTASYLVDAISNCHQITSRLPINRVVIAPPSPKGQTDASSFERPADGPVDCRDALIDDN